MTPFQFLRSFLYGLKSKIIALISLGCTSQFFSLIEAYWYKTLLDKYLVNIQDIAIENAVKGIGLVVLAWVASAFISRISKHLQQFKTSVVADLAGLRIFEKAYAHAVKLSLNYHEVKKTGEVMRQLSKARDDVSMMVTSFFNDFFINSITIAIVIIFFFVIKWQLAFVILTFIPIFLLVTRHFGRQIGEVQNQINTKMEKIHGSAQQAMDSILVVQSFGTEANEIKNVHENNIITHQSTHEKIRAVQKLSFWQGTLINLARLTVIGLGGYFTIQGQMTVGQGLMLSIWSFYVYQPMYQLSELYARFKEGVNSLERIQKLLAITPQIQNPPDPHTPKKIIGNVEFSKVRFAYPDTPELLKDVSFRVSSGKQLAIVGPSGSGKSTITKLLARFYDIQHGAISIDDVDVREWDLQKLRQTIGIVLQETILFHDSILNNIRYGTPKATKNEVIAAAKQAYAHDFIMSLPHGYDTQVGERGIKLSGGEKQRVLIARTILKNPKILILDEATSALDSESEVIVQTALNKLSKNRTTITIAHRLSTIQNADEIVFLEKGKIMERGTHEQLIALNGKYKKYVDLQRKKERIDV